MEPTLNYHQQYDILYVQVKGEQTKQALAMTYWSKIFHKCVESGLSKVLVERCFTSQLGITEMHSLCKLIAELSRVNDVKVAFIDKNVIKQDVNDFAETVVSNWGGMAKVFSSINEAESWLSNVEVGSQSF